MLCGIENIPWNIHEYNIPTSRLNVGLFENILLNVSSPIEYCYESK